MEERVKIIPTIVMRSKTPERESSQLKGLATKSAQNLKKVVSGFDLDEEDVTLIKEVDKPRSIHQQMEQELVHREKTDDEYHPDRKYNASKNSKNKLSAKESSNLRDITKQAKD
mgnify:CR=1 FL=1